MGRIVLTNRVYEWTIVRSDFAWFVFSSLKQHAKGEWGNLLPEDKARNEVALSEGNLRLFSAYERPPLPEIWIVTEADRSLTTVLFADERDFYSLEQEV